MKPVYLFLATCALFTADAIPMMIPFGSPSAPSAPPEPKVGFGYRPMTKIERAAAKELMIDHYKGLEQGDEQKQARLAFAQKGWRDGKGSDDEHMQHLDFNYHRGDTPDSAKIGQTITLSRDRPPPEPHFSKEVLSESKPDIIKEMNKEYKALPPDVAKRVRSMRAQNNWANGPGLREETQITFHREPVPLPYNTIGQLVTVYRPMSFVINGPVPKDQITTIKKRVREEHDKLDESHPFKQANLGFVTDGWHREKGEKSKHVGATLYKVKDELSDSAEEDFKKIGDFRVTLGRGRGSETKGLSRSTRRKIKTGVSMPDVPTLEAPSPGLS